VIEESLGSKYDVRRQITIRLLILPVDNLRSEE
jgi:hypothetical protein